MKFLMQRSSSAYDKFYEKPRNEILKNPLKERNISLQSELVNIQLNDASLQSIKELDQDQYLGKFDEQKAKTKKHVKRRRGMFTGALPSIADLSQPPGPPGRRVGGLLLADPEMLRQITLAKKMAEDDLNRFVYRPGRPRRLEFFYDPEELENKIYCGQVLIEIPCFKETFPAYLTMNKRTYKFKYYITFDGRIPRETDFDIFAKGDRLVIDLPKKYEGKEQKIISNKKSRIKILVEVNKRNVDVMVSVAFKNELTFKKSNFRKDELFTKKQEKYIRNRLRILEEYKNNPELDAKWSKYSRWHTK